MYTIKQAAIRTGVNVPLLRAWERRYGIPSPERTGAGYRLYDDHSIDRVRRMRILVESGWAPSQAARAILDDTAHAAMAVDRATEVAADRADDLAANSGDAGSLNADMVAGGVAMAPPPGRGPAAVDGISSLRTRFLDAARALDEAGMESALGEGLALLGVDEALEQFVMPALVALGEAWSRGELTVAAEHAASNAVLRRLGALYEAAATPPSHVDCVVGLPPGSRHELGAMAFAVACRRAGLRILYLGRTCRWRAGSRQSANTRGQPWPSGAVTAAEADSAAEVAIALRSARPDLLVAVGGAGRARVDRKSAGVMLLPESLRGGAAMLAGRLAAR